MKSLLRWLLRPLASYWERYFVLWAAMDFAYDHPNYTVMRQSHQASASATSMPALSFRSRVACVVTQITAILTGTLPGTTTVILTLLFNNSVAAILTLEESINQNIGTFTLTANRTLSSFTDRFEVDANAAVSAAYVAVCYEYRIVPGATYSLFAAIG